MSTIIHPSHSYVVGRCQKLFLFNLNCRGAKKSHKIRALRRLGDWEDSFLLTFSRSFQLPQPWIRHQLQRQAAVSFLLSVIEIEVCICNTVDLTAELPTSLALIHLSTTYLS